MTCKHFLKSIFLVSEFCLSITDNTPKKTPTKLLEKNIFLLFYADCQFRKVML